MATKRPDYQVECDDHGASMQLCPGDRSHESELVRTYRGQLRGMLAKLTRDDARAEDLTQETLLIVLEKLRNGQVNDPSRISGFIFSTARYVYYGWRRRRDNQLELRELMDDVVAPQASIEDELLVIGKKKTVNRVLKELRVDRDRDILQRYYLQEQTKDEICDALFLSVEHYDRVISRARRRLKKSLLAEVV